jgi:hypothetical protein
MDDALLLYSLKHDDIAAENNRQTRLRVKEEVQTSSAELHSGQRKKGRASATMGFGHFLADFLQNSSGHPAN